MPLVLRPEQRRLLLILLAALVVRLAWWALYVDIIENEGVEYARLAWNWFHDRGYVSIFGGTHTLFPPLYPLLIGLTALATGSEEPAARLVSILAGVAMVGAVYGLARRTFSERVGVMAGCLAAFHPILVGLAASTYSEGPFLGLATHSALATVRAFQERSWRWAAAGGLLAGLAYLTRPEGVLLAVAFGLLLLVGSGLARSSWSSGLGYAAVMVLFTLLAGGPYAWYLSRIAGGFRWEGKSAINGALVLRMQQGREQGDAGRGLGPDGNPEGPFLFPDQHALLAHPPEGAPGPLSSIIESPPARVRAIVSRIRYARWLGSPWLLVLVAAGVLLTPWWRSRWVEGAVLLVLAGLPLLALIALQWTWNRYLIPLLPAMVVWAAAGSDRISGGLASLAARLSGPGRLPALVQYGSVTVLLFAVLGQSARYFRSVLELSQTRHADLRIAGEWIRQDFQADLATRRPRIASIGLALAHYAEGETVYLPYSDSRRALHYLRGIAPDYVAIRDHEVRSLPYAPEWLEQGTGEACAERVTALPPAAAAHIVVWRWKC